MSQIVHVTLLKVDDIYLNWCYKSIYRTHSFMEQAPPGKMRHFVSQQTAINWHSHISNHDSDTLVHSSSRLQCLVLGHDNCKVQNAAGTRCCNCWSAVCTEKKMWVHKWYLYQISTFLQTAYFYSLDCKFQHVQWFQTKKYVFFYFNYSFY